MPNITLPSLTTSYGSVDLINTAFEQIETAINGSLSRSGEAPNQMQAALDMNSQRILNLPNPTSTHEPVTLGYLQGVSEVVVYEPNPHSHVWDDITGKPSTFPPSTHAHNISDVTNLSTTLTGLQADIDALEARPRVFVQATQPTATATGDLWFY